MKKIIRGWTLILGILIGLAVKISLTIGRRNISITGIIMIGPGNDGMAEIVVAFFTQTLKAHIS